MNEAGRHWFDLKSFVQVMAWYRDKPFIKWVHVRKGLLWGNLTSALTGVSIDKPVLKICPARCLHCAWWRHQLETFSALLTLCAGNSPVTGEFHAQRPVTRSFDVFFDLRLNKPLSKHSWGWWFETPSRSLWRDCNDCVYAKQMVGPIPTRYAYLPENLHAIDII